jgi:hypothetical protein
LRGKVFHRKPNPVSFLPKEQTPSGKTYGPMNKGPLPDAVANTFRSGTYSEVVTQGETTLYRVYGGEAGEICSYWTTTVTISY